MSTTDDILEVFGLLEQSGRTPPPAISDDPAGAARTWVAILGPWPRETLLRAALAYDGAFWPNAHQLRATCGPAPQRAPQIAPGHSFPTYAALDENQRGQAIDAYFEAAQRGETPCNDLLERIAQDIARKAA